MKRLLSFSLVLVLVLGCLIATDNSIYGQSNDKRNKQERKEQHRIEQKQERKAEQRMERQREQNRTDAPRTQRPPQRREPIPEHQRLQPQPRVELERHHENWTRSHRRYEPPPRGFYEPRHGRSYHYPRHRFSYHVPLVIFVARIPIIILHQPRYHGCRTEFLRVINPYGYRARVLFNGCPLRFSNGRDFLYPDESSWVEVPLGRDYDLEAAIFIDGEWYVFDLDAGYGSDLIIPDPFR